ncbi:IS66 family insertion sequence element accessory protein TnpB [Rhizobium leguminosarum]|uniref:IS66 family insertion sequence element accessory protein TnpB n=1 Tax=Rhizobium leguminosarum TaxID=384 RepID=UPI003CFD25F8
MRRGIDGLSALVETVVKEAPGSGAIFGFRGKRADRIKLLWWDGQGSACSTTISVHTTPLSSPVDVLGSVFVCRRAAARYSSHWLHCFRGRSPSGISYRL